jgi:hypothetical protein
MKQEMIIHPKTDQPLCPETDSGCSASGHPRHSTFQKKPGSRKGRNGICHMQPHFPALMTYIGELGIIVAFTYPEVNHEHGSNH